MLIDTHAHIQMPSFEEDLEAVLQRAKQAGVERIVIVGFDLESSQRALAMTEREEGLFASVGIHPHDASQATPEALKALESLSQHPKVVALGEMGIDLYRNLSPVDLQILALEAQLQLACERGLPVILHERQSNGLLSKVLSPFLKGIKTGVLHCFSGDEALAQEALEEGFFISIAGQVTYPKAFDLQKAVKKIPMERLLLETDAPYLPPQPYRGKRNEPAFITATAEKVASLKRVSVEELAHFTTQNAQTLFNIEKKVKGEPSFFGKRKRVPP